MSIRITLTILALFSLLNLYGCANKGPTREMTEREFYEDALSSIKKGQFYTAASKLQDLEARFPFGTYSEQAQLDIIYSHYNSHDYASCIASAGRFLRQYPSHAHRDYVLYLRGLSHYQIDDGILENILPTNKALRDQSSLLTAYDDFYTLTSRHPDSPYSPDARSRMVHIRNLAAENEVINAKYYLRRGAFVAAIKRGQAILQQYPNTPAVADGLAVIAKSYQLLGLEKQANSNLSALQSSFPNYEFLDGNEITLPGPRAKDPSWLYLLSFGLLG